MPRSNNEIGILLSFLGYSAWVGADILVKLAAETLAISEILPLNFLTTALFVIAAASLHGGYRQVATKRPWYQLLSAILAALACLGAVVGVVYLSLADFYTIIFTAPLIATIFAHIVLKEKTSLKIWLAIIFGFLGVIVAVRFAGANGKPLSWMGVGFAFLCSLSYCFLQLLVRAAPNENNYALSFWPRVAGLAASTVFLLCQTNLPGWTIMGTAYSLLSGILAGGGVILTNLALRYAPISVVSPYHYTQIIGGALAGYLIWHNVPGWSVIAGAAMVAASGLFILRYQKPPAQTQALLET